MVFVDSRTGLIFQTYQQMKEFQKEHPAPEWVQQGTQVWMNRKGGDLRPLTDSEKLAEIESTKKKYTPEELQYLSSMAAVAEYMAGPVIFLAKWTR